MDLKRVNELFGKIVDNTSSLYDLELGEVKFSKKNNIAIVYIKVTNKVNPLDIINFVDRAKQEYSIDEFKVRLLPEFECNNIDKEDILNILAYIKITRPFIGDMFNAPSIIINSSTINIILERVNVSFLKLKKVDELIEDMVKKLYGVDYKVDISSDLSLWQSLPDW